MPVMVVAVGMVKPGQLERWVASIRRLIVARFVAPLSGVRPIKMVYIGTPFRRAELAQVMDKTPPQYADLVALPKNIPLVAQDIPKIP
ncbi:MAG: hypothetical protein HPY71_14280 [Firmicutes bacterium]|nr:hypothetical protein [Bacillota bacterium]